MTIQKKKVLPGGHFNTLKAMSLIQRINFWSKTSKEPEKAVENDLEIIVSTEHELESIETIQADTVDRETSLLNSLAVRTGDYYKDLKGTLTSAYSDVGTGANEYYSNSSIYLTTLTTDTKTKLDGFSELMVEYKTDVANKYESLDIKKGLLDLISQVNCLSLVASLDQVKTSDPKVKMAITIAQQIILKLDYQQKCIVSDPGGELVLESNRDIHSFIKTVNLRDVVAVIEPIAHMVPYGAVLVYIIKLFIK